MRHQKSPRFWFAGKLANPICMWIRWAEKIVCGFLFFENWIVIYADNLSIQNSRDSLVPAQSGSHAVTKCLRNCSILIASNHTQKQKPNSIYSTAKMLCISVPSKSIRIIDPLLRDHTYLRTYPQFYTFVRRRHVTAFIETENNMYRSRSFETVYAVLDSLIVIWTYKNAHNR